QGEHKECFTVLPFRAGEQNYFRAGVFDLVPELPKHRFVHLCLFIGGSLIKVRPDIKVSAVNAVKHSHQRKTNYPLELLRCLNRHVDEFETDYHEEANCKTAEECRAYNQVTF